MDGTLVSTNCLYLEAYRRALEPYIGRIVSDEEILSHRSHSEIRFLRSQVSDRYADCLQDFQRHYSELHDTHFGGLYPGIADTLTALRQRGVKMGIVTGKSRSSYEVGTVAAELGPFDVLVLDDNVDQPKPSPQGILIAVERLSIDPGRAVYVGDNVSDIEAAVAAGVVSAGALWSKSERAQASLRMQQAGAFALLDAPADILRLI